ncbi:hypothetical protein ACU808_18135, partial [Pandoraea sputorum]
PLKTPCYSSSKGFLLCSARFVALALCALGHPPLLIYPTHVLRVRQRFLKKTTRSVFVKTSPAINALSQSVRFLTLLSTLFCLDVGAWQLNVDWRTMLAEDLFVE